MLCDHLEGWDREGGREGDVRRRRYGDIWGREGAAVEGQEIHLDLSPLSPRQNKIFNLWGERQ